MDAIKIEGLTKKYGDTVVVDHLTMTVKKGEFCSLLGVNGAGKTTTVKMLSGILRPTEGDALLCGKSILSKGAEAKALIAVSPQETAVAKSLTAKENLLLMGAIHGLDREEREKKTEELCSLLGLSEILNKRAGKLSGGQQRRLSIAMALVGDPEILFLDEPTLGLDVIARAELWDLIRSLKGRVTVILTTHYMEEAEALSDRVAILREGKLLILDTVEKIKEKAGVDRFEEAFIRLVREETK